jgi:hypothetical protein
MQRCVIRFALVIIHSLSSRLCVLVFLTKHAEFLLVLNIATKKHQNIKLVVL